MVFTKEQRTFMIESYFRNGVFNNGEWVYSTRACLNDFRQRFPNVLFVEADFYNVVRNTVQLFRETGNVDRKEGSGRPTIRTEEVVENVQQLMHDEPTKSLRHLSQETGLSYGTCQRILKNNIKLFPYKMQAFHELLPLDHNRRVHYCQWFSENLIDNNDLLDVTFFTDEAWFHVSGYINSQNMRMWCAENPHIFRENPLHPLKIGVWVAVSRRRLVGPIFFDGTVTAQRYRDEILNNFINQLHDDELQNGYFQHDGATCHTTEVNLNYLRQFYENRLISLRCDPEFPPRSPDLTLVDYFLFPHLKNTIFKNTINNVQELRDRITEECARVTPETLQSVFNNMRRRVHLCLQQEGGHFQQLL